MLAFRHQLNLTVLLTVGVTVVGLLGLGHYQLTQQVSSLVGSELRQQITLLSQYTAQQRDVLLHAAEQLAAATAQSDWFIVDDKPLPYQPDIPAAFGHAPLRVVVREDGELTRSTAAHHPVMQALPKWPYFQAALQDNKPHSGWLRSGQQLYYVATQSVAGQPPARGAVFAIAPLHWPQLESLSNTGMVVFDAQGKIVFSHPLNWDLPQFTAELETLYRRSQSSQDGLSHGLTELDYVYVLKAATEAQFPAVMLLQSVHNQVSFIHTLLWPTLGILLLVGILWLYMVALLQKQFRQVLDAMMMTVEHIERENYTHRLQLPDRDELSHISDAFNEMLASLEGRERIHGVMAQMTSYEIAAKLLNGTLRSDGELRRCTVLAAEIPNFSALTRKLTEPVALQVLNDYLTRMSFCIEANGGWVDKYMGDTLIALFGLEKHDHSSAKAAIQAAQDMLDAMTLFNLETAAPRGLAMRLHLTLATGKLVTGTVGASHHANYSCFGETINYAISLRRYIDGEGAQIVCDVRTHKLFLDAAPTATQSLVELHPLQHDNAILGYRILPRARSHHPVIST